MITVGFVMHVPERKIFSVEDLESTLLESMLHGMDADRACLIKIKMQWSRVAGNLADHSIPVQIRGEQLVVRTEHSIYQQELRLHAPEIVRALVSLLNGIQLRSLRIERGRLDWTAHRPPSMQTKPVVESDTIERQNKDQWSGERLEDLL